MELAVKDKATECSPLPLTSIIKIYFMLPLNSTTSPSNGIIDIPFIGVERRWGNKSPFGGARNIVAQFLQPHVPSDLGLHSEFSGSHMISGEHGLLRHAHSCRFLLGLLFVLQSLLSVSSLFFYYSFPEFERIVTIGMTFETWQTWLVIVFCLSVSQFSSEMGFDGCSIMRIEWNLPCITVSSEARVFGESTLSWDTGL